MRRRSMLITRKFVAYLNIQFFNRFYGDGHFERLTEYGSRQSDWAAGQNRTHIYFCAQRVHPNSHIVYVHKYFVILVMLLLFVFSFSPAKAYVNVDAFVIGQTIVVANFNFLCLLKYF